MIGWLELGWLQFNGAFTQSRSYRAIKRIIYKQW